MRLLAKIINDETKECTVINQVIAKAKGWNELDLETSYDGRFYLAGYAPEKPEDIKAEEEIFELKNKLANSDYAIIKIAEGVATAEEYADIITARTQWRARINELEKIIE